MRYRIETNSDYGYAEVKPTPAAEEIARYYAEEFYSSEYPRLNDSRLEIQQRDQEYWDECREAMCEKIQAFTGRPMGELSILDIGCGWGETLSHFKRKGASVYGVDPAPEAVEYAKNQGIEARVGSVDVVDSFARKFDVVMLQNVLEHLAAPDQVVERIGRELLQVGGILVVDVPNEFNAFQEAAREAHALEQWWVCPPVHLNYFSHESLTRLLEDKGFETMHLTSSFPIEMFLLFGEQYVGNPDLGRRCHERRMAFELNLIRTKRRALLNKFNDAMAALGLGRQILVYGQKR